MISVVQLHIIVHRVGLSIKTPAVRPDVLESPLLGLMNSRILFVSRHPDFPARQALADSALFSFASCPGSPPISQSCLSTRHAHCRGSSIDCDARKLLYERRLLAELGLHFWALRRRAALVEGAAYSRPCLSLSPATQMTLTARCPPFNANPVADTPCTYRPQLGLQHLVSPPHEDPKTIPN